MPTVKKAGSTAAKMFSPSKLVPAAPELLLVKRRKRLAKAFSRPLDKKLKHGDLVREKFSLLPQDCAQLLELKQRLAGQGLRVKKAELVRAGLLLLATLDDDLVSAALARLPATVSH
jgi:hypothetical protein